MWRKAATIFALFIILSYTEAAQNDLLARLKRSPNYCDYPPPPPPPPPPSAFWYPPPPPPPLPLPPPPPPPSLPRLPSTKILHWEQFIQPQLTGKENHFKSGFNSHLTEESSNNQNELDGNGDGTPPCDKCSPGNVAVSNAKSDTGEAIAIAVSKG